MQVQLKKARMSQVVAQVVEKVLVTPYMVRLTLGGFGMASFIYADGVDAPAAWVKIFPKDREGRAYTIRNINYLTGTIDLDFALHGDDHDDGSVSAWARHVEIGTSLEIAGPASGGFELNPVSTWVWLNADASALPAVHSILASLPAGLDVVVVMHVDHPLEYQEFTSQATVNAIWLYSDVLDEEKAAGLRTVNQVASQLSGEGQVWAAGENTTVKQWRRFLLEEKQLNRQCIVVKGYWKLGEKDYRDKSLLVA